MDAKNVYSALFVDFDNLYISLKNSFGKDAADCFAEQPAKWLKWIVESMSTDHFGEGVFIRHVLIRKCYLNPQSFHTFRPYFINAGFEVIDCPKLTREAKTSTDIHMVMHIMDALQHSSNFDEFILLSADADFTPVLIRVRQHKRLSVVIAAGYSSTAYQASCDCLPRIDEFIQQALGVGQDDEEEDDEDFPVAPIISTDKATLLELSNLLLQKLENVPYIIASDLPTLYRRNEKFREGTDWLGFRSLHNLTRAIISISSGLSVYHDTQNGAWGIRKTQQLGDFAPLSTPTNEMSKPIPLPQNAIYSSERDLMRQLSELIIATVRESPKPIVLADLAELTRQKFKDDLKSSDGWFGKPSFKSLLMGLDLDGLEFHNTTPGYLYDPTRHSTANLREKEIENHNPAIFDEFRRKYPDIEPLASKIHQLTSTPYLLPEHYALILVQLARTVNESGFHLAQTTRVVRDRCVERGAPVARSHVNFIVLGLGFAGHRLGDPSKPETPETLADFLLINTFNLCQAAQIDLTDKEKRLLSKWIVAGLDAYRASPSGAEGT